MGDAPPLRFEDAARLGGVGYRLDALKALDLAARSPAGAATVALDSHAAAQALNAAAGAAPRGWHALAAAEGAGAVTVVAGGLTTGATVRDVVASLAAALRTLPLAPRGTWHPASAAEARAALTAALLGNLAADDDASAATAAGSGSPAEPWFPVFGDTLLNARPSAFWAAGGGVGGRTQACRLVEMRVPSGAAGDAVMLLLQPALLRLRPLQPAECGAAVAAAVAARATGRAPLQTPLRCALLHDGFAHASLSAVYPSFPGDAAAEAAATAAWHAAHGGAPLPRGLAYAEVTRLRPSAAHGGADDDDDVAGAPRHAHAMHDASDDEAAGGVVRDVARGASKKLMRNLELIPLPFVQRPGGLAAPDGALRGGAGAAVVAALCAALQRRTVLGLQPTVLRAAAAAAAPAPSAAAALAAEASPQEPQREERLAPRPVAAPPTTTTVFRTGCAFFRPASEFVPDDAPPPKLLPYEDEDGALRNVCDDVAAERDAVAADACDHEAPPLPPAPPLFVPVIAAPPVPVPPRALPPPPPAPKAAGAAAAPTVVVVRAPVIKSFAKAGPAGVMKRKPGAAAAPAAAGGAGGARKPTFAARAAPGAKPAGGAAAAAPKPRKPAAPKAPKPAPAAAGDAANGAAAAPGVTAAADGTDGAAAPAAAPKKRKAPEEIDDEANGVEVRRRHAAGELAKLSILQIKAFLKANKAPGGLGGAKPALLERLAAFLGGGAAPVVAAAA